MYKIIKRIFDFCASLFALICLSWLLIPVCIILLCTGEHEVFYFQKRIGLGGKPFDIWKFATMMKNSANMGTGTITTKNDPRVLPVGKFLRKTKINELPQLINILIGNMSVIGPRPTVQKEFNNLTPEGQAAVAQLKPGLSGVGSIFFRDEETVISMAKDPVEFKRLEVQPHKGNLEIWYLKNRSLYVDFMLILITAWVVLRPESDILYKVFPTVPKKDMFKAVEEFNKQH